MQSALRDDSTITEQAQQLLAGKDTKLDPKLTRERIRVLSREIKVLDKAIELQKHKIDAAKGAASKMICAAAAPAYREKLQRFRGAIDDLNAAAGEVHQFLAKLARNGVVVDAFWPPVGAGTMSQKLANFSAQISAWHGRVAINEES